MDERNHACMELAGWHIILELNLPITWLVDILT
jgi:hypothetical protein